MEWAEALARLAGGGARGAAERLVAGAGPRDAGALVGRLAGGGPVGEAAAVVLAPVLLGGGGARGCLWEVGEAEQARLCAQLVQACRGFAVAGEARLARRTAHLAGRVLAEVDAMGQSAEMREALAAMLRGGAGERIAGLQILEYVAEGLFVVSSDADVASLAEVLRSSMLFETSNHVGVAAISALAWAAPHLVSEDVPLFAALSPSIVAVLKRCASDAAAGDAGSLLACLEAILELEAEGAQLLNPGAPMLAQLLLRIMNAEVLDEGARGLAAEALVTLCEVTPRISTGLGDAGFVRSVAESLARLTMKVHSEDDDGQPVLDVFAFDGNATAAGAAAALGRLASAHSTGVELLLPTVTELVASCLKTLRWDARCAALEISARVLETAVPEQDHLSTEESSLLSRFAAQSAERCVGLVLSDADSRVRLSGLSCLGTLCALPGMASVLESLRGASVDAVMRGLGDPTVAVRVCACDVAGVLGDHGLEGRGSEILQLLFRIISERAPDSSLQELSAALNAVGSLAAEPSTARFFCATYGRWATALLGIARQGPAACRLSATCSFAVVARAFGKDQTRQDCAQALGIVREIVTLSSDEALSDPLEAVETWAQLAACMGEDFGPELGFLMPSLLKVLSEAAVQERANEKEKGKDHLSASISDVDNELRAWYLVGVFLEAVPVAASAHVDSIVRAAGQALACVAPHPDVEFEVCNILVLALRCAGTHRPPHLSLDALAARATVMLLNLTADAAFGDPERESAIVKAVQGTSLGPAKLRNESLYSIASWLLERWRSSAQRRELAAAESKVRHGSDPGRYAILEFEAQLKAETGLRLAVMETLSLVVRSYGNFFAPAFENILLRPFTEVAHPHKSFEDRFQVVYVLSDVLEHCSFISSASAQGAVDLILQNAAAVFDDAGVPPDAQKLLQTCFFALGSAAAYRPQDVALETWEACAALCLRALETASCEGPVRGNATAALGKVALGRPALRGADGMLATWMRAMPFDGDLEESKKAAQLLARLFEQGDERVRGLRVEGEAALRRVADIS